MKLSPDFIFSGNLTSSSPTNSLDCCVEAVPQTDKVCNKKQEKKMFNDFNENETTETERQRNYLQDQLMAVFWKKDSVLGEEFNLEGLKPPQSPQEFVNYVKEGKFTFEKNFLNDDGSWREEVGHPWFHSNAFANYIVWTDPDNLPDQKGYKAAYAKLIEAKAKVERKIVVSTPAEGLVALEEFEAATYH